MTPQKERPRSVGDDAAEKVRQQNDITPATPAQDARRFIETLYDPDDLIEQRDFVPGREDHVFRNWLRAKHLLSNGVIEQHQARSVGRNVYLSANPRKRRGGKADDVALFRNFFADFDGIDEAEARRRIEDACLPTPTMLVWSGHGVHAYWRLQEPITKPDLWSGYQKALIQAVDSDPVIHDPARVMRWPGFTNNKADPAPVWIIEANDKRHDIELFPQPIIQHITPPATAIPVGVHGNLRDVTRKFLADGAVEPHRHGGLKNAAVELAGANYTIEETRGLLLAANAKCKPEPKPVGEVEKVIQWAFSKPREEWCDNRGTESEKKPERLSPAPEPRRPFPVGELPEPMRAMVEAVAGATGTDPSFAAMAALVVAAGCIGNRVAAHVKRGWTEPAVLWGMLVGKPGCAVKSPVLKLITAPLYAMFKNERQRYREELSQYEIEKARHDVERDSWKKSQRKGPATDPPLEPDRPTERRLIVSDVTVEKLAEVLEDNPLGLLLVRDELAAWLGVRSVFLRRKRQ